MSHRPFVLVFVLVAGCAAETPAPSSSSSASSTGANESASPLDQCIASGGHLLGDGFCLTSCGAEYCTPPAWKDACSSDAACGLGAKCVRATCRISCEADTDCGSLRCVTSCANGYFPEVRFCAGDDGWPANASEPTLCNEP